MMPADLSAPLVLRFEVRLTVPDLEPWRQGNTGVPGFISRTGSKPGPHIALLALSHGNEIAGAIALDRLLRGGFQPVCGRLTFGFVNLAAFARFCPKQPTLSRFVDEDMNRVWDPSVLDGPRRSYEVARAREIRPLIDTVDVLLDLHSMLWPSEPLMLCGGTEKGRRLARAIGTPRLVVSDHGHAGGRRLIDYPRFSDPDTPYAANLVEAGLHWEPGTVETALATISGLLHHFDMVPEETELLPRPPPIRQHFAEVTEVVTPATGKFSFVQSWRGGDVIPRRNTLIAMDGGTEIRTPHDECLLVMPSLRPIRGHTAVRLARFNWQQLRGSFS